MFTFSWTNYEKITPVEPSISSMCLSPHVPEMDLLVNATRADKSGVESLWVVGSHDHHAPWGVHYAVQGVQQTLNSTLHRKRDTTAAIVTELSGLGFTRWIDGHLYYGRKDKGIK